MMTAADMYRIVVHLNGRIAYLANWEKNQSLTPDERKAHRAATRECRALRNKAWNEFERLRAE